MTSHAEMTAQVLSKAIDLGMINPNAIRTITADLKDNKELFFQIQSGEPND